MSNTALVYCACPARLGDKKKQILDFVASKGKAPLHPFNALPYEYFEGGIVGREATLEACCRLIDVCDEFWLFGISEGTLVELEYFYKKGHEASKKLRFFHKQFDDESEKYTTLLQEKHAVVKKLK